MTKNNVIDVKCPADALSELIRSGARQFVCNAIVAEFEAFRGMQREAL